MNKHVYQENALEGNPYAKVDLTLPCKLKDVHFLDYFKVNREYDPMSNRFSLYTKEGKEINLYSISEYDWKDIEVIDCKLSTTPEDYVGYILKIKIALNENDFEGKLIVDRNITY